MLERQERCSTLNHTLGFLRLTSLSASVNARFLYIRLLVKSLALGAIVLEASVDSDHGKRYRRRVGAHHRAKGLATPDSLYVTLAVKPVSRLSV